MFDRVVSNYNNMHIDNGSYKVGVLTFLHNKKFESRESRTNIVVLLYY